MMVSKWMAHTYLWDWYSTFVMVESSDIMLKNVIIRHGLGDGIAAVNVHGSCPITGADLGLGKGGFFFCAVKPCLF